MFGYRLSNISIFFISITLVMGRQNRNCRWPMGQSSPTPCYCDKACNFYNDCCHRFYKQQRLFQCLDLQKLKVGYPESSIWAYVFNRCPAATDHMLKARCERPMKPSERAAKLQGEHILASVVMASDDKRLFRNAYCALCHRAKMVTSNLKLVCKRNQFANTTSKSNSITVEDVPKATRQDCEVRNNIPSQSYRSCQEIRNVVQKCPKKRLPFQRFRNLSYPFYAYFERMTWSDVRLRCSNQPTYYVKCLDDSRIFRNVYCAACHQSTGECIEELMPKAEIQSFRGQILPRYTYSIILDFNQLLLKNLYKQDTMPHGNISSSKNDTFRNSSLFDNTTQASASELDQVSSYLTFICSLLSVLSLLLLIVIFTAVPALRNFAGLLTIALASSLLVGLSCFLIGPNIEQYPLACRLVGIVMYFAYLSSFAWMSLFAADVLKTIKTSAPIRTNAGGGNIYKRFFKFAMSGWLIPLMVTLAAVMVDAIWPESEVSAGFGRGVCYFSRGYALLAWFYMPVTAAIAINAVISIIVIISVWRTMHLAGEARVKSSKNQLLFLSFKITVIFGLLWAFGLVAIFANNVYLNLIVGLMNSLQGACIALSFLLNVKTIREVRSLSNSFKFSTSSQASTVYSISKSHHAQSKV